MKKQIATVVAGVILSLPLSGRGQDNPRQSADQKAAPPSRSEAAKAEEYKDVDPKELGFAWKGLSITTDFDAAGVSITSGTFDKFLCEGTELDCTTNMIGAGVISTKKYGKIKVRVGDGLLVQLMQSQKEKLLKLKKPDDQTNTSVVTIETEVKAGADRFNATTHKWEAITDDQRETITMSRPRFVYRASGDWKPRPPADIEALDFRIEFVTNRASVVTINNEILKLPLTAISSIEIEKRVPLLDYTYKITKRDGSALILMNRQQTLQDTPFCTYTEIDALGVEIRRVQLKDFDFDHDHGSSYGTPFSWVLIGIKGILKHQDGSEKEETIDWGTIRRASFR